MQIVDYNSVNVVYGVMCFLLVCVWLQNHYQYPTAVVAQPHWVREYMHVWWGVWCM